MPRNPRHTSDTWALLQIDDDRPFTWQREQRFQGVDVITVAPGLSGADDDSGMVGLGSLGRKKRRGGSPLVAQAARDTRRKRRRQWMEAQDGTQVSAPAGEVAPAPVAAPSPMVESAPVVASPPPGFYATYREVPTDDGGGFDEADAAGLDDLGMEGLGKGFFSKIGKFVGKIGSAAGKIAGAAQGDFSAFAKKNNTQGIVASPPPVIVQAAPAAAPASGKTPSWVLPVVIGGGVLVLALTLSKRGR